MNIDADAECICDLRAISLDGYSTIEPVTVVDISPAPLYWRCALGCGKRWHRYDEGHPLRELAEPYVSHAVHEQVK